MRRRWTRTDMHLLGARTVFLIAIISIPSFIAWWLIAPSRADIAMEDRLLGKWEVRLAGSDPLLEPPARIIEWLPDGQSADYSPDGELWGRTEDKTDSHFNWRVRNGTLISLIQTPKTNGTTVTNFELNWRDSNNVMLTTQGPSGDDINIQYRRVAE